MPESPISKRAAMRVLFNHRGSLTWRAHVRSVSAQKPPRAAIAAECLIAAPRFHPRAIRTLAARLHYSEAVRAFSKFAEPDRSAPALPAIFMARPSADVMLWRLAVGLALIPAQSRNGKTLRKITVERLRKDAREGARIALAAIGELDWATASKRERAAFALGQLIAAFRERESECPSAIIRSRNPLPL